MKTPTKDSLPTLEQWLLVNAHEQSLQFWSAGQLTQQYSISTAKNGLGEDYGSEKTPRGWHIIRARIGEGQAVNTVFVGRRPTGEIYSPELLEKFPDRDWILTRILWLSGLELNKNRLGVNDTMRRYVYIHGTPDTTPMGQPGSRGCIRMRNQDLIELFNNIKVATPILITENGLNSYYE